jgi:hypothetical protein
MKFVPQAITRKIAEQALTAQKHSPTILLGVGIASMVGSTVLACRATLKLEEVLEQIENDKSQAHRVKGLVDNNEVPEGTTYTDAEMRRDLTIIHVRGGAKIVKLFAPAVILGGVGVACLTKSHLILRDRNMALTAAYVAVDTAFKHYRERVVDRFGENTDRELRHDSERVDTVDEETGRISSDIRVSADLEPTGYARWFDKESTSAWSGDPWGEEHNSMFLRSQQNWCNDMLQARGHLFLNEVFGCLGMAHTSAGSIVGWVYDARNNDRGDNYVDFGCWDEHGKLIEFYEPDNGRNGAILLDFNVDGVIWDLLDQRNARNS